ncbi:MAG: monofunctional biosynthetic peptidoglycan transglycosylase [Bacteroidetes bacterium]|nr:monofunctional biosynthetic peptidoglycan transglycosylase [Bacteroidota bacterium]
MKKFLFRLLRSVFKVILLLFAISVLLTILFRFVPVPLTPLMVIRCFQQFSDDRRTLRLQKDWVSHDEISSHLRLAVVCAEDQNFYTHWGFDLNAIDKAVQHNKNHKRKRGASTISQQVAKNLFLWPSRNWVRKGLEVYFTALIELFWSKQRILDVYLNIIELGDGVYGAEAASKRYFNKTAKKISAGEAALLAAILPRPLKYSAKNPGPYIRKRQNWILNQMRLNEGIGTVKGK